MSAPCLPSLPPQDIVVPPPSFERKTPQECHHCHFGVHNEMAFKIPYLHPEAAALSANRTNLMLHAGSAHFHDNE